MIQDHLSWAAHPERFGLLLPHPVLLGGGGASAWALCCLLAASPEEGQPPLAPHGEKMRALEGLGGVRVWTLERIRSWEESEMDVNWLVGKNHKGSLRGAALGIPSHLQESGHVGNFHPFCPPSCPPLPCFRKLGAQTCEFHLLFLSSSPASIGEAKLEEQACWLRVPFGRLGVQLLPIRDPPRVPALRLPLLSQLPRMCPPHSPPPSPPCCFLL